MLPCDICPEQAIVMEGWCFCSRSAFALHTKKLCVYYSCK